MKPLSEEQRDEIEKAVLEILERHGIIHAPFGISFASWLNKNTRSFEPPTVHWNTSGGTGAMKDER